MSLHSALRNPGTFYWSGIDYGYDWTHPSNDDLWQNERKTLFDPCPAGWRVPENGTDEQSPWFALTQEAGTASWTNGEKKTLISYSWTAPEVKGGTALYSTHPHRPVSALLFADGTSAVIWTATAESENALAYRCSMSGSAITLDQKAGRTNGLTVRCIRE